MRRHNEKVVSSAAEFNTAIRELIEDTKPQRAERETLKTQNPPPKLKFKRMLQPPGLPLPMRQYRFICLIGSIAPQVWDDLRQKVYATYQTARQDRRVLKSFWAELIGQAALTPQVRASSPTSVQSLGAALGEWQRQWNLTAEWCEIYALKALDFWHSCPDRREPLLLGQTWAGFWPDEADVSPRTRGVQKTLKGYGWTLPSKHDREALRWLVRYQCLKTPGSRLDGEAEECSDESYINEESLLKAVKRAAESIELPLRAGLRGPRKTDN